MADDENGDDSFVFASGEPIATESDTTSPDDVEQAVHRAQNNWKRDAWLALPPLLGLAFTSWQAFGLLGLVVPLAAGAVSFGGAAYTDRKQRR